PFDGAAVSEQTAGAIAATDPRRLFASTILICTGLDLLATLSFGDVGGVGKRFMRLLRQSNRSRFDAIRARRLWSLRNGLAHSFGLRAQSPPLHSRRKKGVPRRNYARLTEVRVSLFKQPLDGK